MDGCGLGAGAGGHSHWAWKGIVALPCPLPCPHHARTHSLLTPHGAVCAGIGRPTGQVPVASYVLQPFSKGEMAEVDDAIAESLRAITSVLSLGLDRALSGVRV
jgi:hypothetical protein